MDICFSTIDNLNTLWQEKLYQVGKHDVIVFGFNGLGLVNYKKELSGETEYFQDLAKFSKLTQSIVISGCDTDTYGVFRHSAVVADKGKILGVSDMIHTVKNSEYAPSASYKVYETSVGKIGIVLGEDLFFPDTVNTLSRFDAELIICLFRELGGSMPQVVLRSSAFCNGVAMALCAKNYVAISDVKGNITLSATSDIVKAKIKKEKEYRTVNFIKRGSYIDIDGGY